MKPSDPVLPTVIDRLVRAINPDRIILFGSRARGDATVDSDYDLLIVKDGVTSRRELRRQAYRSLFGLGIGKDIVIATPEDVRDFGQLNGSILKPALDEGVVLYDRAA